MEAFESSFHTIISVSMVRGVESVGSCGGVKALSMFLFSHETRLLSEPITAIGMALRIAFHASKPSRILVYYGCYSVRSLQHPNSRYIKPWHALQIDGFWYLSTAVFINNGFLFTLANTFVGLFGHCITSGLRWFALQLG